jgi:hypothetical protein
MGEAFDRLLGTLTKAELEALVARLPPCDPEEDPTTWTKEQWLAYQRGAATGGRVCDEAMILIRVRPHQWPRLQRRRGAAEKPSGLTCGNCIWRTLRDGRPYCGARFWLIEDTQPACSLFDLAS